MLYQVNIVQVVAREHEIRFAVAVRRAALANSDREIALQPKTQYAQLAGAVKQANFCPEDV